VTRPLLAAVALVALAVGVRAARAWYWRRAEKAGLVAMVRAHMAMQGRA
jgi:hypothetical protein